MTQRLGSEFRVPFRPAHGRWTWERRRLAGGL